MGTTIKYGTGLYSQANCTFAIVLVMNPQSAVKKSNGEPCDDWVLCPEEDALPLKIVTVDYNRFGNALLDSHKDHSHTNETELRQKLRPSDEEKVSTAYWAQTLALRRTATESTQGSVWS